MQERCLVFCESLGIDLYQEVAFRASLTEGSLKFSKNENGMIEKTGDVLKDAMRNLSREKNAKPYTDKTRVIFDLSLKEKAQSILKKDWALEIQSLHAGDKKDKENHVLIATATLPSL